MGVDRRNYVMSAEIAMAREMAFRNKLENVSSESGCSKDPIHSQVPTPTTYLPHQTLGPGMPPGSMPPPCPRAYTNLGRIWTPTLTADQIPMSTSTWRPINLTDQKRKGPINHNKPVQLGSFFCLVCQIDCTTSYNLMMHYKGQRHMSKLLGRGDPKGKKVAGGSGLSTARERLYCKLCGIWCKDEFTFKCHLQCKNHILTHQEYEKNIKKPRQ